MVENMLRTNQAFFSVYPMVVLGLLAFNFAFVVQSPEYLSRIFRTFPHLQFDQRFVREQVAPAMMVALCLAFPIYVMWLLSDRRSVNID